jgi:hypothetical protein
VYISNAAGGIKIGINTDGTILSSANGGANVEAIIEDYPLQPGKYSIKNVATGKYFSVPNIDTVTSS